MVAGTQGSLNKAGSAKMTQISTTAGIDTSKAKLDVAVHGRAKEIEEKVKLLRRAFIKVLSERQRADAEKFSDNQIVNEACYVCAGFLAMLTDDARGRRRVIDEH